MKKILKFQLKDEHIQKIGLVKHAKILSVGNQNGIVCLWAECELDAPYEEREIVMFQTGQVSRGQDIS